jgi:hypothetical protein
VAKSAVYLGQSPKNPTAPTAVDSASGRRNAQSMTEDPGGTVGCDVCGVMVAADKVSLHNEWHRTEDERLEGLAQTLRELVETVQGRRI